MKQRTDLEQAQDPVGLQVIREECQGSVTNNDLEQVLEVSEGSPSNDAPSVASDSQIKIKDKTDNTLVKFSRSIVMLVLLVSALTVATLVYKFISQDGEDDFKRQVSWNFAKYGIG